MNYLIFGSITIIGVFIVIHYLNKRKREKQIAQIREGWGKPKTEVFHFESIKKYAGATSGFHRLTDQTMEDIDLHGLFAFVDRTTSKVGQQFLFKKVIEPTDSLEDNFENLVELFTRDKDLRENVQLELLKLSENDAYHISSLIQPTLLTKPWWLKLLIFDLLVVITLIIFSFSFPVLLLALIIPIALNMYLHYWNKGNTSQFIRSFPQLNVLIQVSKILLKKGDAFYEQSVEGHVTALKSFQQKANFITVDNSVSVQAELSLVGMYVVELLKAIFLIEVFTLYKLTKELETRQGSVVSLFNYVGNIDASISIASLRAGSKTCRPTLTPP